MNSSGGADFVGFTDAGKQISVVTLYFPQDVVGVDDVRFGSSQAVPEPTTLVIWSLLGSLAIGLGWWRKRKPASRSLQVVRKKPALLPAQGFSCADGLRRAV